MWAQVLTIVWAQYRTTRNHLPRNWAGSALVAFLSLLWYGLFLVLAFAFAAYLSVAPLAIVQRWLSVGLFLLCLFWQIIPLITLTGGWSLHLKKLQVYPVPTGTLFHIEALLRITTALEMLPLLIGACVGLIRRHDIPFFAPLSVLLLIPLNLFAAVFIREFLLQSFGKGKLREVVAILVVSLSVLPQIAVRTGLGRKSQPYLFWIAGVPGSPWHETARLAMGDIHATSLVSVLFWIVLANVLARGQFSRTLAEEELMRGDSGKPAAVTKEGRRVSILAELPGRLFRDPLAALIEKEIRSLLRMPRFRVIFGMACFFSVIVFVPLALRTGGTPFVQQNFLPIVNLYGLLLLGDALIWNVFGFDRSAAQTYFASPLTLKYVFLAKNMTAALFMFSQSAIVLLVALLLRFSVTPMSFLTAALATTTVGLFFLSAGNLSSVTLPRAVNPNQTLRKQAGAQVQLWMFGCAVGMFALVGFAYLARWAVQSDWALITVFGIELTIGVIVYYIASDSALKRAMTDRERILDALSKGASQVAL